MPPPRKTPPACPIERCISVLAGRWKAMILWRLREGPWRYRDLADALRPQVTERALTQALRELAENGVVARDVNGWSLTPSGDALLPALNAMFVWGERDAALIRPTPPTASAAAAHARADR